MSAAEVSAAGEIADAIHACFATTVDRFADEPINTADALSQAATQLGVIAKAITPVAVPWETHDGGRVGSLTEAVIYAAQGLHAIAESIDRLADVLETRK